MQAIRKAYPLQQFDEIVEEARASCDKRAEVAAVLECFDAGAGASKTFQPEEFTQHRVVGWIVERELLFYTPAQFAQTFGASAEDLKMVIEKFVDEKGGETKGIFVHDADQPLKVKVQHGYTADTTDLLQTQVGQLRPNQASDFASRFIKDKLTTLPKALSKAMSTPHLKDIPVLAKKFLQEKEEAEKIQADLANLVPQPDGDGAEAGAPGGAAAAAPPPPSESESATDSDVVEEDAAVAPMALPSQMKGKGKSGKSKPGKGPKGKANKRNSKGAKAKGKAKSSPHRFARAALRSAPSSQTSTAGDGEASVADNASVGDSRVGKLKGKMSSREELLKKARDYPGQISVTDILEGKALGHKTWRATQTLMSLRRTNPYDTEVVNLQHFLELCNIAEETSHDS